MITRNLGESAAQIPDTVGESRRNLSSQSCCNRRKSAHGRNTRCDFEEYAAAAPLHGHCLCLRQPVDVPAVPKSVCRRKCRLFLSKHNYSSYSASFNEKQTRKFSLVINAMAMKTSLKTATSFYEMKFGNTQVTL